MRYLPDDVRAWQSNRLVELPAEMELLEALESLLLADNLLTALPEAVGRLVDAGGLVELDLARNPCAGARPAAPAAPADAASTADPTPVPGDVVSATTADAGADAAGGEAWERPSSVARLLDGRRLYRDKAHRAAVVQRGIALRERLALRRAEHGALAFS